MNNFNLSPLNLSALHHSLSSLLGEAVVIARRNDEAIY